MLRLLSLLVVFFWLFSSFSNAQETTYSYDGTLTQQDIDQSVLYGSPQDPANLEEDKTYMDQIIVNQDWAATTGCLDVRPDGRTWNGTEGGQCANSGLDKGTFTFGYGQTVLAQTQDAINDALKIAGISVVGYRWQWRVKNADTNYEDTNGAGGQDPLYIRVIVKDSEGNVLDEREWDYSYHIDGWEQKYGMHWYDPFINGEDIDTITTEIEAYDAGYWAGWYGPEVGNVAIYSIFVYEKPEEELDCTDPLSNVLCPGYSDALLAQQEEMLQAINSSAGNDSESVGGSDVAFVADVTENVEQSVDVVASEPQPEVVSSEPVAAAAEVVEESSISETQEEKTVSNVDALSVAQNAVSAALSEAASTVNNTLSSTAQTVADAENISNSLEETRQETQLALDNDMQTSLSILEQSTESQTTQTTFDNTQQNQSQNNQSSNSQAMSDNTSGNDSNNDIGMDNSGNIDVTMSFENSTQINTNGDSNSQQDGTFNDIFLDDTAIAIEITVDSFEIAALDLAISDAFNNVLKAEQEIVEESIEESEEDIEKQNAKEDELVEQALSGDDSEDAQAALLGYNPQFRAYQTPQMEDGQFYQPKEIYGGQQNYDNPSQRFFNGASDAKHKEMVRQQYK